MNGWLLLNHAEVVEAWKASKKPRQNNPLPPDYANFTAELKENLEFVSFSSLTPGHQQKWDENEVKGATILQFVKDPKRAKREIENAKGSQSREVFAKIVCHTGEVILAKFVWVPNPRRYQVLARVIGTCTMSILAEIEAAADALPERDKQQLLRFLAARLRAQAS